MPHAAPMPQPPFRPIAAQLTRTILLWSLLATVVIGAWTGWRERHDVEARLQAELRRHGETLADAVAEAIWNVSPDLAQPQLRTALNWTGVAYVAVMEVDGRPWVEGGDLARRGHAADVVLPLMAQKSPHRSIGELHIVVDRAAIDAAAWRAALRAGASGLLLTAVVLVIVMASLRRRLQQPMLQLSRFIERLDAQQLDARLTLDRPGTVSMDEIDQVAARFTTMQQRIAEQVRELDTRVAERTEQLQTALDTLKTLAVTDALTGCHNRLAFSQRFPETVTHAERYGRPLSLVFCDIDRFKSINDQHGHPVGDRVLAAVGACLRDALRASSDWVVRYGGEEFVLVLPETPLVQAQEVAERLREQIEQAVKVELADGRMLDITASLGVAEHRPGERGEDLLNRADQQLYAAKQAGRNRVQPPLAVVA